MICRICKGQNIYKFLDLGEMPIPNGFLRMEQLNDMEFKYPLGVCVCLTCWLVQLTHVVPAEVMFKNYLYIPSTSETMLKHFKILANDTIRKYKLTKDDLVIDIGSNDGILLSYFREKEVRILGVDPASNLVKIANMKGIETIDAYFTYEQAEKIAASKGKAKVITATNVVAHIDNLHDLVAGVKKLLTDDGVFIMEFPYFVDLLDKSEFDTIYHEHLSYFSVLPLMELFKLNDMEIIHIKRTPIHGGSILVTVTNKLSSYYRQSDTVHDFVKQEKLKKLNNEATYTDFARRVKVIKRDLLDKLTELKSQGKKVVGYGAAAKGNVLLNYCGITMDLMDYVVDSIPYKQGLYTPGTHIPIFPESKLLKDQPDFALILAWNFADEIIRKNVEYRMRGGRFIITIPYLRYE